MVPAVYEPVKSGISASCRTTCPNVSEETAELEVEQKNEMWDPTMKL
jgi:hypothetical protein